MVSTDGVFYDWMDKVNSVIEGRLGLSSDDLPDCCYRDMFDAGMSPAEAAREAIHSATE